MRTEKEKPVLKNQSCDTSSCFLCKHCNASWRELIAIKKKTIFFKKGKQIFKESDAVTGIYFMYSGTVKVHKEWVGRRELIIRFARAGDVLGHRGFGSGHHYPVSATALEDTTACFITNEFFETTLNANHSLTYTFMQFYSGELQKAEMRMRNLALMDVPGRIAETLLEMQTVFGTGKNKFIPIPVSRQDIAAHAGTTYETVFKFLRTIIAARVISVSGKSIRINDPARLQAIVQSAK